MNFFLLVFHITIAVVVCLFFLIFFLQKGKLSTNTCKINIEGGLVFLLQIPQNKLLNQWLFYYCCCCLFFFLIFFLQKGKLSTNTCKINIEGGLVFLLQIPQNKLLNQWLFWHCLDVTSHAKMVMYCITDHKVSSFS